MGTYYLDIETDGLDEIRNKIIPIQDIELERETDKQLSWEKDIPKFIKILVPLDTN